MSNLAERRAYWNEPNHRGPAGGHDMKDSIPYPFGSVEHLFFEKDVLEIGPGRGRQYERLKSVVKSYSICDIAPAVLLEPAFTNARYKFLIDGYDKPLGEKFDVVHFWYVLHHVRLDEMALFFKFVSTCLRSGGIALFNTPWLGNAREWYVGDGINTTLATKEVVIACVASWFDVLLADEINDRSNGFLFVIKVR